MRNKKNKSVVQRAFFIAAGFITKVEISSKHLYPPAKRYFDCVNKTLIVLFYFYCMADVHSKKVRSYNMSRLKGQENAGCFCALNCFCDY
jgi:hypothetical protein